MSQRGKIKAYEDYNSARIDSRCSQYLKCLSIVQVSMLNAGSTVMLLTILWGSCVVVGKCDLAEDSTAIDSRDTQRFSLFGSGVSTDLQTSYAARTMAISVLPFIVVQIPKILRLHSGHRLTILLGFIIAVLLLLIACIRFSLC